MRHPILVVLIMFVAGLWSITQAQDDEKWYFAQNTSTGQVIAYTAEGQVFPLLEDVDELGQAWRLDTQSALGVFIVDGTVGVYYLTPDGAMLLLTDFDINKLITNRLTITNYHEPYTVLVARSLSPNTFGLLVDTDKGTLESLADTGILSGLETVFFSADGDYLRYIRDESPDDDTWVLVERTLSTGEERSIFTLSGDAYPLIEYDSHGDYWLYARDRPVNGLTEYIWIANDGSTQTIGDTGGDSPVIFHLFNDRVFTYPFTCETNCTVELRPLDGSDTIIFSLPVIESGIAPVAQPDATHLLVFDYGASLYWLLGTDGSAAPIGYWSPQYMGTYGHRVLSPDGRFLFVLDSTSDPQSYSLVDLSSQESVFVQNVEDAPVFVEVTYNDFGILVTELGKQTFLLNSDNGQLGAELPDTDRGFYFEVLPDSTLLYLELPGNEERSPGIYLYNPDAQMYTLLIEDAVPVCADC